MAVKSQLARIAVLSTKDLKSHRYDQVLVSAGCEVALFAEDDAGTREFLNTEDHGFAEVHLFGDWQRNRAVDLAILAASAQRPFDRIVALGGCDMIRAAQLRAQLGLPGQDICAALAFRDAAIMRELAGGIGLAVAAHSRVEQAGDLLDFAAAHGWEIALKPRDGAGAARVEPLRGKSAVESWIEGSGIHSDDGASLLAEERIDAPVIAVDGLMSHRTIQAAIVTDCAASRADCMAGVLLLDRADRRSAAAIEYVEQLLEVVPGTTETMSFHSELFATEDRGLLLCELTCWTGGAHVGEIARQALDIDLECSACLGQAGIEVEVPRCAA